MYLSTWVTCHYTHERPSNARSSPLLFIKVTQRLCKIFAREGGPVWAGGREGGEEGRRRGAEAPGAHNKFTCARTRAMSLHMHDNQIVSSLSRGKHSCAIVPRHAYIKGNFAFLITMEISVWL